MKIRPWCAFLHQTASLPMHRTTVRANQRFVRSTVCRWMGSKPLPENPAGEIFLEDEQDILSVDLDRLRNTATRICHFVGYHSYDLSIFLVDDEEMRKINLESRGIDRPTDILSFPFGEAEHPGKLITPQFDIPDMYNLGDIVVDVPYVIRGCNEDAEMLNTDSDLRQMEKEDRGVSRAMATEMDPERRMHMLLVHGILHLIGHDHIKDGDYEVMTRAEEDLLDKLDMTPKC